MKKIITLVVGICLFLYPFAVYLGLNYISPFWLGFSLFVLLSLRLFMLRSVMNKMPWLLPATVLGGLAVVATLATESLIGVKLYPLMVNCAMLTVFGYSYLKPPTVIETFARLRHPNLPEQGVNYTRKVTLVWCAFFILNASISLYTAVYTSVEMWTIYNGLVSYILMGILFTVEFIVRFFVQKSYPGEMVLHEK